MPKIESGIIKIHAYELRIGMCISRLETIEGQSSLFEQFDIKTQADIQAIQTVCDYVFIDDEKKKIMSPWRVVVFTESLFWRF